MRRLLMLSPLTITGICLVVVLLSEVGRAVATSALLLCSVVWAFALYLVAQAALNEKTGYGRVTFPIAFVLLTGLTLLPSLSEVNHPLYFLAPIGMMFVIVSILLAVSALLRAEGRSGWPFGFYPTLVFFGIVFLPLGIWFLRKRVNTLLQRT